MEKRFASVIFAFSTICIHFLALSIAQPIFSQDYCFDDADIYMNGSLYQINLKATFSSIFSNNEVYYGFYNLSSGKEPDRVNTIALCKGDVSLDVCQGCLRNATQQIQKRCPNRKEAIGWYTDCMIRYSNRMILGTMETEPWFNLTNVNYVRADIVVDFGRELQNMLVDVRRKAAVGDWRRKFAAGDGIAGYQIIYALVQCTPDLTEQSCTRCLDDAIGKIPLCCDGMKGARVFNPSCNIRFETYSFFNDTPELPPLVSTPVSPTPTFQPKGKGGNRARTVIIVIIPVVSVLLVTIVGLCIFLRWRKQKEKTETVAEVNAEESFQYNFNIVRTATNDFSDANKLGQGGFGSVYKGTLPDGQEIAVKRLSRDSRQGDLEFKNEVLLVAKLQHRNLVQLLGYCLEGNERLLIYEFVPNAGLDHFLFDPTKRVQLDWERRYKIIGGIARGLLYLHEDSRLRIIHRDLKTSNVLLNTEMNPKIADFGIARLFEMDETQGNTSRIVGTYGYMAPEYAMHGQISVKTDVFSFGVLVLEIVTGRKNNFFHNGEKVENLIHSAWRNWMEGTILNLVDPTLMIGYRSEITRCIHIALLCVQEDVSDRPTMASAVLMLNSPTLTLRVPSEPVSSMPFPRSGVWSSSIGHTSRTTQSDQSRISEVLPLSSTEASNMELHTG